MEAITDITGRAVVPVLTPEMIRTHYPDCEAAVMWLEQSFAEDMWMRARSVRSSIDQMIVLILESQAKVVDSCLKTGDEVSLSDLEMMKRITGEVITPGFRRYVASKLGLL